MAENKSNTLFGDEEPPHGYLPKAKSSRTVMFVAVLADFKNERHRSVTRRSNNSKVAAGWRARTTPKRYGSTLVEAGIPRSTIIGTREMLAPFFYV
jgi:hypothetical protein